MVRQNDPICASYCPDLRRPTSEHQAGLGALYLVPASPNVMVE
jgi:hypothetical protein